MFPLPTLHRNWSLNKLANVLLLVLTLAGLSCSVVDQASREKTSEEIVSGPTAQPLNGAEMHKNGGEILAGLNSIWPLNTYKVYSKARLQLNVPVAKNDLLKVCDGGLSWRVVYLNGSKEVWIAKDSGKTYAPSVNITFNADESAGEDVGLPIGDVDAVEIASAHFDHYAERKIGAGGDPLAGYFASACYLSGYWRVYFIPSELGKIKGKEDLKNLPNSHPPDYIINQSTGRIRYFNYYSDK